MQVTTRFDCCDRVEWFMVIAMQARRDDPSIPAWSRDRLDSSSPPEIEPPYFDNILEAWVLSRHADILAAFRASSLAPASPGSKQVSEPSDESGRLKMRREAIEALSPARLRTWRGQLTPEVHALAGNLPTEGPVDLMEGYARPLCLSLAAMVTGISRSDAEALHESAKRVSATAAEPYDPILRVSAKSANAELRGYFHSGPEALRDSGFVALSQTMPCILGGAWFALMQHPQEWSLLHRQPGLMQQAIEELLRYAGLVRILSRTAMRDVDLNGALIRKGDRIILRIIAANRDPERFPHPNRVDVMRRGAQHLTLGAGSHACVAASLIRMAAIAITRPLVQRFASANLALPVDWRGGSGFRFPKSLWVCLTTADGEPSIGSRRRV
jgi:cytochrome P450